MRPSANFPGLKPLFRDGKGQLVLGDSNTLYLLSEDGRLKVLVTIPETVKSRLLANTKWTFRLARLGFGTGAFFNGLYFFSHGSKIYSFCPQQARLCCEFSFRVGRGPLSFTVVDGIEGFEKGIYFGEYFSNRERAPVYVYKRSQEGKWDILYSFSNGEINHIHGIVPDPFRNCLWLLAGDFEHSASIWMVKDGFSYVRPVLSGEQTYRACVAFPLEQGLLYATDTQITHNSVRLLKCRDGVWVSESIFDINGSCIYGCELKDYYIFSTATEPSDNISNAVLSLFDCRPGPGILENKSDVLAVSKKDLSSKLIFSKKKDFLPYRLFQFGVILFPCGVASDNTLFSYSIGNKGNDLSTEVYDLDFE